MACEFRWPHAQPCPAQPQVNPDTGKKVFRCRECPGLRWVFQQGRWKWLCDECGKQVQDTGHFTSQTHVRQRKQTQAPGSEMGFPDPQVWVAGGAL